MTSFNYGGKKASEAGLTCRYHPSNIMPDGIFCNTMGWGDNLFFFFVRVITSFLQHERDGFRLVIITSTGFV